MFIRIMKFRVYGRTSRKTKRAMQRTASTLMDQPSTVTASIFQSPATSQTPRRESRSVYNGHHSVNHLRHCSAVAGAIPPNVPIFHVPYLRSGWDALPITATTLKVTFDGSRSWLGKAKRARVNRDWLEREALELREQLRGYLAFFDLIAAALPRVMNSTRSKRGFESTRKRNGNAGKKQYASLSKCGAENRQNRSKRFLAGDPYVGYISGVSPMLRVSAKKSRPRWARAFHERTLSADWPSCAEYAHSGQEYIRTSRDPSRQLRYRPYRFGRRTCRLSCREVGGDRADSPQLNALIEHP